MSSAIRILRIPRSDESEGFVVLRVESLSPPSLDLRLTATEGENPFAGHLKSSEATKLRTPGNTEISDGDWDAILRRTLLQQRPDEEYAGAVDGVGAVAALEGAKLVISLRRLTSGIKQRLGSINLDLEEEEEIDTVAWAATAAAAASTALDEVATLQLRLDEQGKVLEELERRLEDVIQAKKTHEDQLLEQFSLLLNAKKQKIRDQNRLLASTRVDRTAAAGVQVSTGNSPGHDAVPSRLSKRKTRKEDVEKSSSDSGFEKLPHSGNLVKSEQVSGEDDGFDAPAVTSESSTDSESDSEVQPSTQPPERPTQWISAKTMEARRRAEKETAKGTARKTASPPAMPPRRELPFNKAAKPATQGKDKAEEKQSETDDEEL